MLHVVTTRHIHAMLYCVQRPNNQQCTKKACWEDDVRPLFFMTAMLLCGNLVSINDSHLYIPTYISCGHFMQSGPLRHLSHFDLLLVVVVWKEHGWSVWDLEGGVGMTNIKVNTGYSRHFGYKGV